MANKTQLVRLDPWAMPYQEPARRAGATESRGYLVQMRPGLYAGEAGLARRHEARRFPSVGAAHASMRGDVRATLGYSVVPKTTGRA